MAGVREWLLALTVCAALCGIVLAVTPEGAVREIVKFCASLVMLLCLLRPLGAAQFSVKESFAAYGQARAEQEELYRAERDNALLSGIAERSGAYIEDTAGELGLSVRACVRPAMRDGNCTLQSVILYGSENEALSALIERDLGIPRTRQEWREGE